MDGKWCEWHVIRVEVDPEFPDDAEIDVMHPDCPFTFGTNGVNDPFLAGFHYHCSIQFEIDNVGYDTLLHEYGTDKSGWYRARMRHYTLQGHDFWQEIDVEYEVEELTPRSEMDITVLS